MEHTHTITVHSAVLLTLHCLDQTGLETVTHQCFTSKFDSLQLQVLKNFKPRREQLQKGDEKASTSISKREAKKNYPSGILQAVISQDFSFPDFL